MAEVNAISFDGAKGEVDCQSGHRRWVRDALERRLKKAVATGTVDLSGPAGWSLAFGYAGMQLDLLPKELFASASRLSWAKAQLKRLYLTNNALSLVSPEIALFEQLTVLGLGGNALTSLPPEIGALAHLHTLHAERNQLTALPEALARCSRLAHVTLDSNRFHVFPAVLTKCTRLEHLSLSDNELLEVPPQIRRLTRLIELNLDRNHIGPDLPPEIGSLTRLQRLGLALNCLADVPRGVLRLPQLTHLRLDGNRAPGHVVKDPITGEVLDGVNVPTRFDGYLQLRQAVMVPDPSAPQGYRKQVEALEGLVPTAELNLENAFHDRDKDEIGRKIIRGRK
ncbi:hypothetical protein ACHHYP_01046 [Achlya hypogyna]|uniref:Disease resistance R13L4/SHOC-2-like LRR domain-containing protein n=1 Tax=Achlya hypogyna TaxID=1202772 RepID=A0A1V9ZTX2_ACHHY|nr:hypothetical protein ACHHYP_01046 [Achlya hypogyna]